MRMMSTSIFVGLRVRAGGCVVVGMGCSWVAFERSRSHDEFNI